MVEYFFVVGVGDFMVFERCHLGFFVELELELELELVLELVVSRGAISSAILVLPRRLGCRGKVYD